MKHKNYDTVGKYQTTNSEEAIRAARKELMKKPEWPLCVPHWKPFALASIPNGQGYYEVFLRCEGCLRDSYNQTIDNTKTEDLLG